MCLFTLLVLVIGTSTSAEISEDGALELTEFNFHETLADQNFLVLFYTNDCEECDKLDAEFAKAAKELKEKNVPARLGKVDGSKYEELANRSAVSTYPAVRFYRDGLSKIPFTGKQTSEGIIHWLERSVAVEIDSVSRAEDFKGSEEIAVIGFFGDRKSEAAEAFLNAGTQVYKVRFGITTNKEVMKHYGVEKDSVVIFRKDENDNRNDLTENLIEENIRSFIENYQLAAVTQLTEESTNRVFNSHILLHVVLMINKKAEIFQSVLSEFTATAETFRGKALFLLVDTEDKIAPVILSSLSVKKEECPSIRFFDIEGFFKYRPEYTVMTASAIQTFVQNVLDGKLPRFFMSEDIPADWDKNPVKILVGKNFKQVVDDPTKDVVVLFGARGDPWEILCEELIPVWDQLAEAYKDKSNLVFARVNATFNEIDGHTSVRYPSIKYFQKGGAKVFDFKGEHKLEEYKKFVDSEGTYVPLPKDKDVKTEDQMGEQKDEEEIVVKEEL